MKTNTVFLVLILLFAALLLSACEEEEEEELLAQDWINRGLKYLGQGDGTSAYLAFSKARELESGNLDAQYGQVLANILQMNETIDLFGEILTGQGDISLIPVGSSMAPMSKNEPVEEDQAVPMPSLESCEDFCHQMYQCGYLGTSGWGESQCSEICVNIYPGQSIECFNAVDNCDLGLTQCFLHVGQDLQGLVDELFYKIIDEMLTNLENIIESPDWTMMIPKYSFSILDILFQPSFTGENDRADAYFMNSVSNGYAAVFNLLFALDLDFNPILLTAPPIDASSLENIDLAGFDQGDLDMVIAFVHSLRDFIHIILTDPVYPDFLATKDETGIFMIQEGARNVGAVFGQMVQMIDAVAYESDEQWDDAIRYMDKNGNEIWEDGEYLMISGVGAFEKELVFATRPLLLSLKVNFSDGMPFALNSANDLLGYYDLDWVAFILDALYVLGYGEIDIAYGMRNPDPKGLRPLLEDIEEMLELVELLLSFITL